RSKRDWSSDVCSSDLIRKGEVPLQETSLFDLEYVRLRLEPPRDTTPTPMQESSNYIMQHMQAEPLIAYWTMREAIYRLFQHFRKIGRASSRESMSYS